jgi:hypothetical protein
VILLISLIYFVSAVLSTTVLLSLSLIPVSNLISSSSHSYLATSSPTSARFFVSYTIATS